MRHHHGNARERRISPITTVLTAILRIMHNKIAHHLSLLRIDHWVKNLLIIPGIIAASFFHQKIILTNKTSYVLLGIISTCLASSANYILNEILDRKYDKFHPTKKNRPLPSRKISPKNAWILYVITTLVSIISAAWVNQLFLYLQILLLLMGIVYNAPPIRSKDIPYIDTLSESINNPLRLLLGWSMIYPHSLPPLLIIITYWMLGGYLMGLKRYAEFRFLKSAVLASKYRKSFIAVNEHRLLTASIFYANSFWILLGIFIAKYRLELILAVPCYAIFMQHYLTLSLKENSPAQYPELLYKEKFLLLITLISMILTYVLLFMNIPLIYTIFQR